MSRGHAKQARRWARKFNRQKKELRAHKAATARLRVEWDKLSPRHQAEIAAKGAK